MDLFIESLAEHRLSKECKALLEKDYFYLSKKNNAREHLLKMFEDGHLTKEEYIFCESRILLKEYSSLIKNDMNGLGGGFFLFSKTQYKIYYTSGCNYPESLKNFFHENEPLFDCFAVPSKYYDKDHFFVVNDLHTAKLYTPIRDLVIEDNVKSVIFHRLHYNGIIMGSFAMYFDKKNVINEKHKRYLEKQLKIVSKTLYHLRDEMLQVLKETEEIKLNN